MKKRIIKFQSDEIMFFSGSILMAILFTSVILYIRRNQSLSIGYIILIVFILWMYLFQILELFFKREFVIDENGKLFIYWLIWKIKLDKEVCYLKIDDMFALNSTETRHPFLSLYINNRNFLKRMVKNKIKLYKMNPDNTSFIFTEANTISQDFGIPFRDTYQISHN